MRSIKILIAAGPLILTLLLGWRVAGGLSLGGGEKDIVLVLPLLLWSILFLFCFLWLWKRKASNLRSASLSALVATGLTILLAFLLFFGSSWLRS